MLRSIEALRPDSDLHFHLTNNKAFLVLVKIIIMMKKKVSVYLLTSSAAKAASLQDNTLSGTTVAKYHLKKVHNSRHLLYRLLTIRW